MMLAEALPCEKIHWLRPFSDAKNGLLAIDQMPIPADGSRMVVERENKTLQTLQT